jgi:hypothetical protein
MFKIYKRMKTILAALLAADQPSDPLATLSPRDWADLPVYHPRGDRKGEVPA